MTRRETDLALRRLQTWTPEQRDWLLRLPAAEQLALLRLVALLDARPA